MLRFKRNLLIVGVIACIASCFLVGCATVTPNQQLLNAIDRGDMEQAKISLNSGADPGDALANAVEHKQLGIARLLLGRGADPNMGIGYIIDGLVIVIPKTNEQFAINTIEIDNNTISVKILSDDPQVAAKGWALVLGKGQYYYRYKLKKMGDWTPLFTAIRNNDVEMIHVLLEYGAVVEEPRVIEAPDLCPGNFGLNRSAIFHVVLSGAGVSSRSNVGKNCVIDAMDKEGYLRAYQPPLQGKVGNALEYARSRGNTEVIQILENTEKNQKGH